MQVGENEALSKKKKKKTGDMEVNKSVLQDTTDGCVAPRSRTLVKREAYGRKSLKIFGLEEKKKHIPAEEERVERKKH